MNTLHVLNTANTDVVNDCLPLLTASDALLLADDGVLLANSPAMQGIPCPVYALDDDMKANGVGSFSKEIQQVDMIGFVRLTEQHLRQVSWA